MEGADCHARAEWRRGVGRDQTHTGLGHTANTAVMQQGPQTFFTLQGDDIAGLQVIYPGALLY
jgi:hypothetical protein